MLEERKVQKAKITLMRNPKFALLSGVLMVGKTSVVDNIPTACTNGRDERYGRAFVKSLRDQELNFLVAHENGHKMYRHLTTWRKLHDEDHALANQACDYVINLMLKDLDPTESVIAMPRYPNGHPMAGKVMGLVDERFRGMNSKQVFDILKQEKEESGEGDGDGDGEGGGGMDDHDWNDAKNMTEEEKKELEREIDQAIRQGMMARQKIAGSGADGLDRELAELLEPKINWREVLRDFVKSTCNAKDASSWRRVNRRFLSTGMYMPTLIGEKVGHLVIAVDTSGSVGDEELGEFLSEVKGIAEEVNPACVDLLYWGSSVVQHETYGDGEAANIIASTRPKGGGGTSPSCISEYLKEKNIKPECVIILTDGCVGDDWGSEWTAPTLWCIVGDYFDGEADNGKTIHIKN
jgi:predicted metal-dependent peptidase